ncbi:putative polyketide synthase [Xylariales sp. AK1849]|nr:putative polyketide synthase [Xylariales sp. AK1849]
MIVSKLNSFERLDLTYATVNGQPLQATVLTPKRLQAEPPGLHPVLVHWHGGGFIVGHRMYEPWWPKWTIELALFHNAIIISPDYRLLPEATASEILEDVQSVWRWVHNVLPALSKSWHARPNLDKVACCGESVGGWLSIQSALLFPTESRIRAIISSSAPIHANIPHFTVPKPRTIMGSRPPPSRQAEGMIRSYLKHMQPGTVRAGCDPSEMWELVMCIMQQAWLPRLMSAKTDNRLDVMENLDKADKAPPMWIIHGLQDSFAPPICSTEFANKVATVRPDIPLLLTLQPGDHMFDAYMSIDEGWIRDGCKFLSKYWP